VKINSLQDLKKVQKQLALAHEQAQAEAAARAAAARLREAESNLFARAVGAVQRMDGVGHALSDEFDASTLLDTDDMLSFRRPGIGRDVTHKLRKGDWAIQGEVDLHGLRSEEARVVLAEFIRHAHRQGLRCLRVVHGKGLGSPGKTPVLKSKVHSWLVQKNQVMAFVQAKPAEGGAGALVVLLKPAG
jgi:DNA-nicking Smr family endonuclease